jgi:hypothetical protein
MTDQRRIADILKHTQQTLKTITHTPFIKAQYTTLTHTHTHTHTHTKTHTRKSKKIGMMLFST